MANIVQNSLGQIMRHCKHPQRPQFPVWFLNFEGMFWIAVGFGYVIVLITLGPNN